MNKDNAVVLDENVKITNGNILRVYNKSRKKNAKSYYWFTYIKLPSGKEIPVMMTDVELQKISDRAMKNSEDIPKKSFLSDMLD